MEVWVFPKMKNLVVLPKPWSPPPADRVAPSVDGSPLVTVGSSAAGMILRWHDGFAIFVSYQYVLIAMMLWKWRYM